MYIFTFHWRINNYRIFLLLTGLIFTLTGLQAQDDGTKDQIPQELRQLINTKNPTVFTVVTINDYDNFFIGTDFAETHLVSKPGDPLKQYGAWNSPGNDGGRGYATNNGYNWTAANPSWGNDGWGDIVLAYDSLGNLYFENMYGSGSPQGCKVAVSNNNGTSWSTPTIAIYGNDKNWIAADQTAGPYSNYVYATMTSNGGGNFARSTDFGQTWQNMYTFNTQSLPGMMVCVGPNGNIQGGSVHVVTNSGSTTASTYTFYVSNDGGATFQYKSSQNFAGIIGNFTNNRHSVQNMRTRPYPFIAADNSYGPHRGRLYIVYASNTPAGSGNKPDIFSHYSDDDGATWSSPVVVNDDTNTQQNHNFFPSVWCDKETGRFYIQWLDTRDTPTSDSALVYATYSDDGGQTFAPNVAVSNHKMKLNCTTCPGAGTPRYQGDYNGTTSNSLGAVLSWTDFRNGNFDNYVGYFPDFALRLTPAVDTLYDSLDFAFTIPSVKLYTDTVFIEASTNAPTNLLNISFPQGNKLWNYPGTLPVRVTPTGSVPVGNYTLTVTAYGSNGTPIHKRTSTIRVVKNPMAAFKVDDILGCVSQGFNFTDQSFGVPSSWNWTFENATPASSTDQHPANIHFNTPGTFDVTLVVTNAQGIDTLKKADYVTIQTDPILNLGNDTAICNNNSLTLNAGIQDGATYVWSPTGTTTPLITLDTATIGTGTHSIYVTATNTAGCTVTDSIQVTFVECTAIPEYENNLDIKVYPNPFEQTIHITLGKLSDNEISVALFNATGAAVFPAKTYGLKGIKEIMMEIPELTKGIYFLRITGIDSGRQTSCTISKTK